MNRITRTAVVLMSGLALANGARADFFLFKKTPPATSSTPDQAQTLPAYQTQPPPLAADMPVQGSAPMPISSVAPVSAQAPATAPRTVPPATLQNNVVSGVTENVVVGSQALRVSRVNSKLVQVGYDIKDYGPSGIAGVEVWYTRDGQTWQKFDGIQRENPAWVELEEGTYGLTLVAKTGFGGGKEPPVAGDQPQLWVEVDLTKPVVFLNGVNLTNGTRTLNITWTARDDHFGRQPINLYYAERSAGPWLPIALGVENTGGFVWQIPPSIPSTFVVRIDASDLAGNVGSDTSPSPVQIDLAQPQTNIIRLTTPGSK